MFEKAAIPSQTPSKQAAPRSRAGSRENLLNMGHQVGLLVPFRCCFAGHPLRVFQRIYLIGFVDNVSNER